MISFCDVEFFSVVVFFVKFGCKVCGVLGGGCRGLSSGVDGGVQKRDRDGEINYLRCWWDWT